MRQCFCDFIKNNAIPTSGSNNFTAILNDVNTRIAIGDFDGDGKSDIFAFKTANRFVTLGFCDVPFPIYFSLGDGTWNIQTVDNPKYSVDLCRIGTEVVLGDFNGDGKTDLLTRNNDWDFGLSYTPVLFSRGDGTFDITHDETTIINDPDTDSSYSDTYGIIGDFHGKGKTEIALQITKSPTANTTPIFSESNIYPDLLNGVTNSIGGKIKIEYNPSSSYHNTQLPFPIYTISSITSDDGNGNESTTTYSFSGGFYHIGERDFRGFNYTKVIGPMGTGGEQRINEAWFHQGVETDIIPENSSTDYLNTLANVPTGYMKGKPYRVRVTDSQGNKYSEVTTIYTPNADNAAPYFTPPLQVDNYLYDGGTGTAYNQTRTVYAYDTYGNVIREDHYGDIGNPANFSLNKTITRSFLPNITDWILGLPASQSIYQGIGTSNSATNLMVGHTDYYYDDLAAGNCNAAPTNNQTPLKGNLTRVVKWLDGGSSPEIRTAYDGYGNPTCVRDANLNVTSTGYETTYKTFPTSSTNAKNQKSTSTYYGVGTAANLGNFGQLKSTADPNNAMTTSEYDIFGRKTRNIQPDGFWTRTAYNSFGTVGSQNVYTDNQLGMWSASYFDGLGRTFMVRKSGPNNKVIVTKTEYDPRGTIKRVSVPYFEGVENPVWRTYTHDPLGRVTQTTNPDATSTLGCYSSLVSVFIDENGHRRRETRDTLGRLVTVEEYSGVYTTCDTAQLTPYATTSYSYDVLGNLTGVTDANQKTTQIRYDTLGRKKNMTDPDMGYWEYGYYGDGTLYSVKDAKQQTITYDIDALNRPTHKHYPSGSGATDVIYAYDEPTSMYPIGRLTSMTDGSGKTTYNYELSGRITETIKRVGNTDYSIGKSYDGLGRITSISYPNYDEEDYEYDLAGNLTSVGVYAQYTDYNALGQPGKIYYGYDNATLKFGTDSVTSYWYYPQNYRLQAMKADHLQTSLLYRTYGYDNKGNVTGVNDLVSQSIPHNLVYGSVGYTLDPNRAHAVQTVSTGRSYQYDANGNMLSDGLRTVTYTPDNLPQTITMNGSTTTFTYDGNGNRVKKTSPVEGTRLYIGKLYECTSSDCSRYIYAGNTRIAKFSVSSYNTIFYHPDHLGSTAIVTDGLGNKVEDIAYYPFGETRQDSGSIKVTHKYTGQEQDYETNLYDYGARMYDPEIGRFISPDSLVPNYKNPQSLNRYAYTLNNPLRYIDPSGNVSIDSDTGSMSSAYRDALSAGENFWNDAASSWQSGNYGSAFFNAILFTLNSTINLPVSGAFDLTIRNAYNSGVDSMAGIMRGDWNAALRGSFGLLTLGIGAELMSPSASMSETSAVTIAESGEKAGEFLYRGVSANHPAIAAAREGTVLPGNINGIVTEELHNAGGMAADSPFTSWTRSLDVANFHALKDGPGGVILQAPVGAPLPGSSWSWAYSPDVWGESEVLMQGIRSGLEVIKP